MAQLLNELHQEGKLDSEGEFTLDFAKAVSKLREYQLERPEDYPLKWLQAAVAAGSREVRIKSSGDVFQFVCDGLCPEREELEGLARYLVHPDRYGDRRDLVHLAIGTNSALACQALTLMVESQRDGLAHILLIQGDQQQLVQRHGVPRPVGLRIFFRKWPGGGFPSRFTSLFEPEMRALQARAAFCPVPVWLNHRRIDEGNFGRHALPPLLRPFQPLLKAFNSFNRLLLNPVLGAHKSSVNVSVTQDDPVMPWWVLIWNVEDYVFGQCHRHHHLIERRHYTADHPVLRLNPTSTASIPIQSGDGHAEMALAIEMDLRQEACLQFVQDGVVLTEKTPVLGYSGAVGVISAEGLKTDLSQFDLVEDEAYQARLAVLRREFGEMTLLLRAQLEQHLGHVPLGRHVLGRLRRA